MAKLDIVVVAHGGEFNGFVNVTITLTPTDGSAIKQKTGMVIADKPLKFGIPKDGKVVVEIGTATLGVGVPPNEDDPVGAQEGLFAFGWCPLKEIPSATPGMPPVPVADFKSATDYTIKIEKDVTAANPGTLGIHVTPIEPEDFETPPDAQSTFTSAKDLLEKLRLAMDDWHAGPGTPDDQAKRALKKLKHALRGFRNPTSNQLQILNAKRGVEGLALADLELIPIDTACSTCVSLYGTSGTPYYHNITWYNNCMTNPQCT